MVTKKTDRLNGKQRAAIKEFERGTGFEFMYVEDINADRVTFRQAWRNNEDWMRDWLNDILNGIDLTGCGY